MNKLTKRDFLKITPVLGAAAATPILAADENEAPAQAAAPSSADLIDDNFESASGLQ